jgi:hypothetical protein
MAVGIIQFIPYLFTYKYNNPETNYKFSTSKKKKNKKQQ